MGMYSDGGWTCLGHFMHEVLGRYGQAWAEQAFREATRPFRVMMRKLKQDEVEYNRLLETMTETRKSQAKKQMSEARKDRKNRKQPRQKR